MGGKILSIGRLIPIKMRGKVFIKTEDTPMKKLMNFLKKLWKDESAQGATEYILLLVVVVGLVVIFKDKIMAIVKGKVDQLGSDINKVTGQ